MQTNLLRDKSIRRCKKLGVSFADHLPPVDEIQPRSAKDVAERIIVLYVLIGLAEPGVNVDHLIKWSIQNEVDNFYYPKDKIIIEKAKTEQLTKTDIINLSWLRESILVLGWYIAIVPKLKGPFSNQSFSKYMSKIPPAIDVHLFIDRSYTIPQSLLIAELDFFYCLHNGLMLSARKSIDVSTVIEQRRALEWLASSADWYDVFMDT